MKNTNFKYFLIMIFTLVAMFATSAAGAFAISFESRQKAEISLRIREKQKQIAKIKRETEDLGVRIAQQENPAILGKRTRNLTSPKNEGIVWVYEDASKNEVVFAQSDGSSFSFRITNKNKIEQ